MDDSKTLKNIEKRLSAVIALLALSLPKTDENTKVEVLLKKVGLEISEIALMLGKNEPAVRKAIERANK